jgi:hypothetical protein
MFISLPLVIKGMLLFALALFVVGAFLVLIVPLARAIVAQLSTARVVNIASAKIGSGDVTSYLMLRAKELGRGVHLDALYEIRVPPLAENFGSGDTFKLPPDLKFEFQGVDVPGVITSLLKVLPDDRYTVNVDAVAGASNTVRVEWSPPKGKTQTWLVRAEQSDGKDQDAINGRLVDRVIATILHYMYYDPAGPLELRADASLAPNAPAFPNARALEAYFVGQQYLNAYLRSNDDPSALDNAEAEFRRLQTEMPEFVDGLMLLGVTLSEKRDEANAIVTYRHAKDLLAEKSTALESRIEQLENTANTIVEPEQREDILRQIAATKAARIAAEKTFIQARLFQANAYRKLYSWDNLVSAISELDAIEGRLSVLSNQALPGTSAQDRLEFEKIGAVAQSEKANSLGYGLILLYPETFADALKGLTSPRTLEVAQGRRAELTQLAADLAAHPGTPDPAVLARRNALFASELGLLAEKQSHLLGEAREAVSRVAMPADASAEDRSAWEKEKKRLESLLLSAEGYGIFRGAQLALPNTKDGNKSFVAACDRAVEKLREADAKQPGQYAVLQDLGIILGDPRYDAGNRRIGEARRYFERAYQIKPNDYFSPQSLAVLAVRQGYAWGFDPAVEPFKSAATQAAASLQLRPGNGTVLVVQAQLAALSYAAAEDDTGRKKSQDAFEAAIASARNVHANPTRILLAELQWRLMRLRTSNPDPAPDPAAGAAAQPAEAANGTFTFEKKAFAAALTDADGKASRIPGWEPGQLRLVIAYFQSKLATLAADGRDRLVWPPEPLPAPN